MAGRFLCDGIATLIRTPILYLSAYLPAAVLVQSPGEFRKRSLERMVDGTITVMTIQKLVRWCLASCVEICVAYARGDAKKCL